MTRKNIFFIWLSGSLILMMIASVLSIVVWNFTYQPAADIDWRPIDHFFEMLYLVPVGWLLSFMTVFGWVSILFMCVSVYKKWPMLLYGSAIATLLAGAWWPVIYTTMFHK